MSENWLQDSTVIVTGSSRGIGREIAGQCAEQGANVVVNGRSRESVREVVEEMQRRQQSVLGVVADVTDPLQAEQLVKHVMDKFGRIDALFNTVGSSGVRGSILECSREDMRALVEQNVCSVINTTRAALPHLQETHGRVVNMGSIASIMAPPNYGGYAIAKFGVHAATNQMKMENPDVSFTLACPGPIRDGTKEREPGGAELKGLDPEQLAADIIHAAGSRKRLLVRPRRAHLLRVLLQVWPAMGEKVLRHITGMPDSQARE